ncbi:hypothetical protein BDV93DRAFT_553738 [Ceratobasidium sp. AG-I]|nr:hypothetical protein BDV93DRAFT_553738 [Ceratobasidium sp. AG-I]
MPYSSPHQRCWVYVDIDGQPLDVLNRWKDTARATVDWDVPAPHHGKDNVAIHVATPTLTCNLYHPPREADEAMFRRAGRRTEEAYQHTREQVENWLHAQHQVLVELHCEYYDTGIHGHARFSTYRISFVSHMNYVRMTDCRGTGRSVQEAKNNAARNLLNAGCCMIYGQFSSPRRVVC